MVSIPAGKTNCGKIVLFEIHKSVELICDICKARIKQSREFEANFFE